MNTHWYGEIVMARSGAQSWPAYIYDPMHLENQLLKQLKYKHSSPDELIAFWYGGTPENRVSKELGYAAWRANMTQKGID